MQAFPNPSIFSGGSTFAVGSYFFMKKWFLDQFNETIFPVKAPSVCYIYIYTYIFKKNEEHRKCVSKEQSIPAVKLFLV